MEGKKRMDEVINDKVFKKIKERRTLLSVIENTEGYKLHVSREGTAH